MATLAYAFRLHLHSRPDTQLLPILPHRPGLMCRQHRRVQRLAQHWQQEVLLPADTLLAAGLAYHLADLALPELARCVAEGGPGARPPGDASLRLLLQPFCAALASTDSPALLLRLRCVLWGVGARVPCVAP